MATQFVPAPPSIDDLAAIIHAAYALPIPLDWCGRPTWLPTRIMWTEQLGWHVDPSHLPRIEAGEAFVPARLIVDEQGKYIPPAAQTVSGLDVWDRGRRMWDHMREEDWDPDAWADAAEAAGAYRGPIVWMAGSREGMRGCRHLAGILIRDLRVQQQKEAA